MYFNNKTYFNNRIVREVEVERRNRTDTRLTKPKSRKKKKLTRNKKARRKFSLTQLRKELGNDLVVKLLLRLVEGRGTTR